MPGQFNLALLAFLLKQGLGSAFSELGLGFMADA